MMLTQQDLHMLAESQRRRTTSTQRLKTLGWVLVTVLLAAIGWALGMIATGAWT